VVATGGISIPKMGATDFAYRIARQFGAKIIEPTPALVPLIFDEKTVSAMKVIAGVSAPCSVSCGGTSFRENLLFTHRGLSGPAILQISSYWQKAAPLTLNLLPDIADVLCWLKTARDEKPKAQLKTVLAAHFADRLANWIAEPWGGNMADMSNSQLQDITARLCAWQITPIGTEGFKKAEVTKGGVNTNALSSKTMEMKSQPGLYFIGESVDVTGWLGGYNFQWAWASGHACGQHI
jgi:predicted Rossmann fold flavoprotein